MVLFFVSNCWMVCFGLQPLNGLVKSTNADCLVWLKLLNEFDGLLCNYTIVWFGLQLLNGFVWSTTSKLFGLVYNCWIIGLVNNWWLVWFGLYSFWMVWFGLKLLNGLVWFGLRLLNGLVWFTGGYERGYRTVSQGWPKCWEGQS